MFYKLCAKASVLCLLFLTASAATAATKFDFDGDGKADIGVFRPSNGVWYILGSSTGFKAVQFGVDKDRIVPADYDGDGKTDLAVYRSVYSVQVPPLPGNDTWHILKSSDNTAYSRPWGITSALFSDRPIPADYDYDGKTDLAVSGFGDVASLSAYRVLQSSTNTETWKRWGYDGDKPVLADYDGDGKDDLAVFRQLQYPGNNEVGFWFILQSSNGQMKAEHFGLPADRLVPADYDGDGKADIAVWRPSTGIWYIRNSRDNSISGVQFGAAEDKPVPADYDGDGKTDIGVFRPSNGTWYLLRSRDGFATQQFGQTGDVPVENAYVR